MEKWKEATLRVIATPVKAKCRLCSCSLTIGQHFRLFYKGRAANYVHEDCFQHWNKQ